MGLYCVICNCWRNKFAMPLRDGNKKIIGHVCIKCVKKAAVVHRQPGLGWREAFKQWRAGTFKPVKKPEMVRK